jgi:hypothetical protein
MLNSFKSLTSWKIKLSENLQKIVKYYFKKKSKTKTKKNKSVKLCLFYLNNFKLQKL